MQETRQKWYWAWVDNYKTREEDLKLKFGDLTHRALAIYYKPGRKRGPKPAGTFEQLAAAAFIPGQTRLIYSDDEWHDAVHLGVQMLERYVEHWKDKDAEYEVISSEQVFQVPIGTVMEHRVICVGTIDGVWRHLPTGKVRFLETKTAAAIHEDMLPMDEQIGSYWAYGPRYLRSQKILKPDEDIDGILYNWLRKAVPDSDKSYDNLGRVLNKDGSVSKRQPPPYFHRVPAFRGATEAKRVTHRVKQQVRDMLLCRADPERYVYKNPGPQFLPNCKFCPFRDPCELHETGHKYNHLLRDEFIVWDPYEDHELAERF